MQEAVYGFAGSAGEITGIFGPITGGNFLCRVWHAKVLDRCICDFACGYVSCVLFAAGFARTKTAFGACSRSFPLETEAN
ncbi:hypothetical protein A9Q96_12415 [Rhodobacterales bacterium 52_120_T64]|nr:hypothetical protein A9Q96_12415 [Rhodobacterales bacterium 52_120_T64]